MLRTAIRHWPDIAFIMLFESLVEFASADRMAWTSTSNILAGVSVCAVTRDGSEKMRPPA